MLPTPLVFLDTETTGLSFRKDRIIEIGLLRVENKKVVATYQTLLNPQTAISPFITEITGILQSQLEDAPEFGDISRELRELLDGTTLVAHNARFDYGFLKNEFAHAGMKYSQEILCSAKLSRVLFPKYRHHNLDSIIERFALPVKKRHRAYDDALAVWHFFKKILSTTPEKKLQKALRFVQKHPSLPIGLSLSQVQNLPEGAGVYIFYDKDNTPLYVGKSIHVKDRVKSHFTNDTRDAFEMHITRQIHTIEAIPTSGELGALLKEAELVKVLQPIYNRKLRASRRLIALREVKNSKGYTQVTLDELTEIDPFATSAIIATFKSKKQAKEYLQILKRDYMLCDKLLGLEAHSTSPSGITSSCFSYRLGNCKGACIGKENPLIYNTRCIMAFSKHKIKPWPFTGAVVITEHNKTAHTTDEFFIDKWCILGKRVRTEGAEDFTEKDYRFDMDTYKILLRYLQKSSTKRLEIHPVTFPSFV